MKNFVQEGKILDFTAPSGGVVSGVPLLIGALIVVPATTAAEGERFAGAVEGVFELPAATHASNQAWTEGQLLYWDNTAKKFTVTATDNTKKGAAAAVKASTADTGSVKLIQAL
jgi:predicted RecA/RadA family phage recombinase